MGDNTHGKDRGYRGAGPAMVIAMFMILEQLQIAPEIVRIAFAACDVRTCARLRLGVGARWAGAESPSGSWRRATAGAGRAARTATEEPSELVRHAADDRTYAESG